MNFIVYIIYIAWDFFNIMYFGAENLKIILQFKHLDHATKFLVHIIIITVDHIEGILNSCVFSLKFLLHLIDAIENLICVINTVLSHRSHEFLTYMARLLILLLDKPACRSSFRFCADVGKGYEDAQKRNFEELH